MNNLKLLAILLISVGLTYGYIVSNYILNSDNNADYVIDNQQTDKSTVEYTENILPNRNYSYNNFNKDETNYNSKNKINNFNNTDNNNINNINNINNSHNKNDKYETANNSYLKNTNVYEKLCWYDFDTALKHHLSDTFLNEIPNNIVGSIKGKNILETSWNIGKFENDNIKYNYTKANNGYAIKYKFINNKIVDIIAPPENKIQTPYETIVKKSGICTDYTILTLALLKRCGYNDNIYAFKVEYNGKPGHIFAGVKYNNIYYAIDQHIPIEPVVVHLNHLSENDKISNVIVYKIKSNNNGIYYIKSNFTPGNEKITIVNINNFNYKLLNRLSKKYNINIDKNLKSLKNGKLPSGYRLGNTYTYTFNEIVLDKNLENEFLNYFMDKITGDIFFAKYDAIYTDMAYHNEELKIFIYLGKRM